ncbi:hypothetical protein SH528x_001735 [Novipirellula sp. SH528]|uniref:hypothetical protein n=1 Tax=Novipirellula sp. SH528 TaxID=3454466 RepID=UPI003FA04644
MQLTKLRFPTFRTLSVDASLSRVTSISLCTRVLLPLLAVLSALNFSPSQAQAEKWTGLRGDHSVEADLLGIWEGNAILKLTDGRRVSVPLINLISDSRIRANKVNETIQTHRAQLVSELKSQAEEAAAPAPTPLPQPAAAPDYRPLANKATAIETLQHISDQSASGHLLLAYFDSLPPKYRADIDGIVKAGTPQLDAARFDSTVGPLYKISDLIITHQTWIFNHPRMLMLDGSTRETLQTLVLGAAGAIRATLDPEALSAEKLESMQLRDWLVERDRAVAPHLYALNSVMSPSSPVFEEYDESKQNQYGEYDSSSEYGSEMSDEEYGPPDSSTEPAPKPAVAEKAKPESDDVKIKVTQNGRSVIVDMVRVDDYWIPKSLAENWKENVASTKEKVAASGLLTMVDHPAITAVGSMLQPTIDTLSAASNAEEFHQRMESVFQQAQTFTSVLGGVAGNSSGFSNPWQPAKSSSGQRSSGSDGYSDEMRRQEMDMQYDSMEP